MTNRRISILSAALVALAPAGAAALDAPHDQTFSDGACANCHSLAITTPSGATNYTPGCTACHNARTTSRFGFPWLSGDQAASGVGGNHHTWTGFAQNPRTGSKGPSNADMQRQLVDGRIQCTVCHDPHVAAPDNADGRQHTSIAIGVAVDKTGGGTAGTGKMTLASVDPATLAKATRVQIQTVTAAGGTFILSHDFGLATPSWFNWVGGSWVAGTLDGPGQSFTNDTNVAIDDPMVLVRFGAGTAVGNYWDFWISYPFLRIALADATFCTDCHAERNQTAARVRGVDAAYLPNGVRKFSHPVGEGLNSNGLNRDRTDPLDPTGVTQAAGDGNTSNDLVLPGGVVRCTTCHALHGGDSNSLSVDPLR